MNWVIEFIKPPEYAVIASNGLFTVEGQIAAIEDLISHKSWRPGLPLLVDQRKLDYGTTDITMIKQTSIFHQGNDSRIGSGRIAVVMKSMTDFGRGRQFELLSEGKISAAVKIFRDEEKALEWLLS